MFKEIRIAAKIAAKVADEILPQIKAGMAEKDIASLIRKKIKQFGGERESFRIIVASGNRSAIPHGYATSKKIKNGEFVMIDFGAVYKKFRSDITRTIVIGKPTKRQSKIYNIVENAQKKAMSKIKQGIPVKDIDSDVRKEFRKYGLEKYFPHSTGHGIGKKVHEEPRISSKVGTHCNASLKQGMVITIEPGLYFKGWGGVRIEDMVLVKKNGYEILTK